MMKIRNFILGLLIIFGGFFPVFSQDAVEFVDVKITTELIARLERANENHTVIIANNNERKSFLESRIGESETRMTKIEENLAYARETNLELNAIRRETRDKETLLKLDTSRAELMSVIWILETEFNHLDRQTIGDKDDVEFLTADTARREKLIERNQADITELKQAVALTESKINEISSKLDSIVNQLSGLREEVTTGRD